MADVVLSVAGQWNERFRDMGDGMHARQVVRAVSLVEPAAQATVNAWAPVAGSVLDATALGSVSYTCRNADGANGLNWRVIASNDAAFAATVEAQASALLAAGASGSYAVLAAPYRFYRVEVQSAVPDNHASAVVVGLAKS